MIIKILASVVAFVAAVIVAGTTGLSFYVWPTGFNDQQLAITPAVIERLRSLQSEHKFGPDTAAFYPGAASEAQRAVAQASVDATIQTLIAELPARPQRSTVLRAMKVTLADIDTSESEERDQILVYLDKVMTICGIESSDQLFNVWRYGFPYGWFL
ncbi:DUF4844 domain-containing protein [Duganella sp. PWIR1]